MTKLILFIFLLSSCSPRISTKELPFIVRHIHKYDTDNCRYCYRDRKYSYDIIAPCGMFNIGDTIRLTK